MDQELRSNLDLEVKPAFSAKAATPTPTPAGLTKASTATSEKSLTFQRVHQW